MATCSGIFFYKVFSDSSCFIFITFHFITLKGPFFVSLCSQRQAEAQRWSISWLDIYHMLFSLSVTRQRCSSGGSILQTTKICWFFSSQHNPGAPPCWVLANTSGFECWLISAEISQECVQKFPLYTGWTICTLCQLWNGLVRPPWPNLLLVDHVSYQNQALTEHAYSYSYFNWRTNYNVVFTDHSSSRNSFDTETCITSALRWVIQIVFSFKRPILSPFCYPPDLLVQAEGCAGLQGCVILNLSYRTWLTKNLEH